jgi:hypothetical protein
LVILGAAWIQANTTVFLNQNMQPDKVFSFYKKWLMKKYGVVSEFDPSPAMYKMLGGCLGCFNIWLSFISFVLLQIICPFELNYWLIAWQISYSTTSNHFLTKNI